MRAAFIAATVCAVLSIFPALRLSAQDAHFHNAPTSSLQLKESVCRTTGGRSGRWETVYDELRVVPWNQWAWHREHSCFIPRRDGSRTRRRGFLVYHDRLGQ